MSAQEIFEAFLVQEPEPAKALEGLCTRHPVHADALRQLWAGYQRVVHLLGNAASDSDELPGAESPRARYEVRGEIARGGMGRVLEVWDGELRRTLAMKVLRHEDGGDLARRERARSRLINEAQILGQLEHPAIVPIHEVGHDDQGRPYFTMLRVRGRALGEVFDDVHAGRQGWSLTRTVGALLRVCEAVAHAHGKGVIHRDLKPSNVMVGPFGEVYVMDWGLAKAGGIEGAADIRLRDAVSPAVITVSDQTETRHASVHTDRRDASDTPSGSPLLTMDGDVVGTPSYMAPEQAEGRIDDVGERSDVYSVGAMLYHLLSGRAPYAGDQASSTPQQVLRAVLAGSPEPLERVAPKAARELAAICARAMARDPDQRYAGMAMLADDLRAYLEGRVVRAYRTGPIIELRKWVRRNKGTAAAIAVTFLGVVAVVVIQSQANEALAQRAEELRQQVYFNDVALAQAAHQRGDTAAMQDVLARCPPELRGWEWQCLHRMADTSDVTLPHGGAPVVSPDGQTLVTAGALGEVRFWDAETNTCRAVVAAPGTLITHPAFSPDGTRLYVGDRGGILRVYDVASAELEREVDCRVGGNTQISVAPSPDGKYLALSRDSGALDLWSADTFEYVARLDEGIRNFQMSAWSRDGKLLFAGCADRETDGDRASAIRVYDMETRKRRNTLHGHDGWVGWVAPSPDGRWLASGGWDHRVLLWDLTADPIEPRRIGSDWPDRPAATWTPDSRFLLTTGGGRVQVWSTRTWTLEQTFVGHTSSVSPAVFLPGDRVVTADANSTKVWRLGRQDRVVERALQAELGIAAFSPDGKELAMCFASGYAEIWNTARRRRLHITAIPCNRTDLCYTADGTQLLSLDASGWLRVWDADGSSCIAAVRAHDSAGSVEAHPDGRCCATASGDAKVRLWDLETMEMLWSTDAGLVGEWPAGAGPCAFSPSGDCIAVGAADGHLRILDTASGGLVHELRAGASRYADPAFSPDGQYVVSRVHTNPLSLVVWELASGDILWSVPAARDSHIPTYTADGTRILTASTGGALVVRDAATGTRIVTLEHGPGANVTMVAASRNRETVVLGTNTGALRFWTSRPWETPEPVAMASSRESVAPGLPTGGLRIWTAGPGAGETVVRDTNDGLARYHRHLAAAQQALAAGHGAARVRELLDRCDADQRGWEWHYLRQLSDRSARTFAGHDREIADLAVSRDGAWLATVGADSRALVWGIESGEVQRSFEKHPGSPTSAALSPGGELLATTAHDGAVHIWDVARDRLLHTLSGHRATASTSLFLDGERVATGGADGTVRVWHAHRGEQLGMIKGLPNVARLAVSRHRGLLGIGDADECSHVRIYDAGTYAHVRTIELCREGSRLLQFSVDGSRFVTGSWTGELETRSTETAEICGTALFPKSEKAAAALSPDHRFFAHATRSTVRVVDLATGRRVAEWYGLVGAAVCVVFSPDGSRLFAGDHDGTVKMWDLSVMRQTDNGDDSLKVATALRTSTDRAVSPDGKRVFSVTADGTVRISDAETGRTVAALETDLPGLDRVAISGNGQVLVAGSAAGVHTWVLSR